jgi:endonuclease/exonuclease/phosphatase (EEP) superfamily protein YafD
MLRTPVLASLSLMFMASCVVGDDAQDDEDLLIEAKPNAEIRVVTHNIWKQQSALQRALNKAEAIDAQVISLQELCPGQVQWLVDTYGSQWTIGAVKGRRPAVGGCELPDGTHEYPYKVVIYRGRGGTVKVVEGTLGGPANAPGNDLVCVKFERAKVPVHACSVHLISADWVDPATQVAYDGAMVREQQATGLKRLAREWFDGNQNHFGILAGDFNSQPDKEPMNKLYAGPLGGNGDFTEYNRGGGRDGGKTVDTRKIDYIFFSANRAPINGAAVDIIDTDSDHHMVVSTVQMRK